MVARLLDVFFFFNDTATTEIYTLSLHDALPICSRGMDGNSITAGHEMPNAGAACVDRKSTRLNSSHGYISYAVFCLKKKTITCRVQRSGRRPRRSRTRTTVCRLRPRSDNTASRG